jgi:hypothetical protein
MTSRAAFSGDSGVQIVFSARKNIETDPGKIVSTSVLVSNTSAVEKKFTDSLELPQGWQVIVPTGQGFEVEGGTRTLRFISFRVPSSAPAGQYRMAYSVRCAAEPSVQATETLTVDVLSFCALEMSVEEKPENVIAGESYKAVFKVVNRGNAATGIRIDMKSVPLYQMELSPHDATLMPGASQSFVLTVKTDDKMHSAGTNVISLRATASDVRKGAVYIDRSFAVRLFAKMTGTYDPYIRIPTQVSFLNLRDQSRGGLQWALSGGGKLDDDGKKQIDYLFRSPDLQRISTYGLRDEYRVRYSDPNSTIMLGDHVYYLSPLLENFLYGRGAGAAFRKKRLEYGGYVMSSRWVQPAQNETALFAGYRFNDNLALRGNYLSKSVNLTTGSYYSGLNSAAVISGAIGAARLGSLTADFKPLKGFTCEAEYGICDSNKEIFKGSPNNGYQVKIEGRLKNGVSVALNKIYAAPRFYGYYNDTDYTFATVSFPLLKKMRSYITYRSMKDNLGFDISRRYANFQTSCIFGTSYYFPSGLNLSLEYEDYRATDLLLPYDSNFATQRLRLGAGKQMGNFNLQTYLDRGSLSNYLQNSFMPLDRVAFSLSYNPSSSQTYSIYTTNGYDSFYVNPGAQTTCGASTSISFGDRIRFGVSYDNTRYQDQQVTQNMTGSLSYYFKDKSYLSLLGYKRRGTENGNNESTLFLSYTVPFGIPTGRKKSVGILRGTVCDVENRMVPVRGAVLIAGDATAVTDEKGAYIFPSLKPGRYSLSIERTSIGVRRITSVKMPMNVEIRGGDTLVKNIGITTGCMLTGRVVLYAEAASDKKEGDRELFIKRPGEKEGEVRQYTEKGGVGSVIVELSNGEDTMRQYTDESGRFYFSGIPPGIWTLKANSADLPELTYLEKESDRIELKAGESVDYTFKALPRKRVIKIIDTGPVKKENK